MKTLSSLEEVVDFIKKKHSAINKPGNGVYGLKFLRKSDGKRVMFEEIQGLKLFDWKISGTELIIHQLAVGFEFKGKTKKHTLSSTLFLRDLVMINIYDHCAQFFSHESIDFAYVEDEYIAHVEHLIEWMNDGDGGSILRAQWISPDKNIDRLLEEISIGRTVEKKVNLPRQINMGMM